MASRDSQIHKNDMQLTPGGGCRAAFTHSPGGVFVCVCACVCVEKADLASGGIQTVAKS